MKAKVKNSIFLKIGLIMEGAFIGNNKKLKQETFIEMLELKCNFIFYMVILQTYYTMEVN